MIDRRVVFAWSLVSLALVVQPALGGDEPGYAEQARALGLTASEISALSELGVVVSSHEYRQTFVPYPQEHIACHPGASVHHLRRESQRLSCPIRGVDHPGRASQSAAVPCDPY